ncbi:MAG TPA: transposase [Candidatus Aminicenantes bacterium]|nr:transposase [Candidatus Aminicenantes bacterium]HRY65755.1 transposase [Candidatus Aminicenantes bacterium]HRZ72669.1 transposase [Candidatus Aminicenantes bacterium]
MARLARSTIVGYPHHVVQRGNYEQPVFESETDYRQYLAILKECAARYALDIWAYCLMPNHVHLICVPRVGEALARANNTIHMRYAQYFNGKHTRRGHLWRARFLSCALDRTSVKEEIRFVENNPVRTGLVGQAEDYPWSSARAHVAGTTDSPFSLRCPLTREIPDWRAYLRERGEEAVLARTRARLRTGRPSGDPEFMRALEAMVGRRLEARPRGRPRKAAALPGAAAAGSNPTSAKRTP